jgi:hypothetical protein
MGIFLHEVAVEVCENLTTRYQKPDNIASEKLETKKEDMITKLRFLAEESYKNANPFWLRVR